MVVCNTCPLILCTADASNMLTNWVFCTGSDGRNLAATCNWLVALTSDNAVASVLALEGPGAAAGGGMAADGHHGHSSVVRRDGGLGARQLCGQAGPAAHSMGQWHQTASTQLCTCSNTP